jgi:hypothetical protein
MVCSSRKNNVQYLKREAIMYSTITQSTTGEAYLRIVHMFLKFGSWNWKFVHDFLKTIFVFFEKLFMIFEKYSWFGNFVHDFWKKNHNFLKNLHEFSKKIVRGFGNFAKGLKKYSWFLKRMRVKKMIQKFRSDMWTAICACPFRLVILYLS